MCVHVYQKEGCVNIRDEWVSGCKYVRVMHPLYSVGAEYKGCVGMCV